MTAFVLLYGDYPELAKQFLEHWNRNAFGLPLRVGMNGCGEATRRRVRESTACGGGCIQVLESETNLGKAPMMRRMFRSWPIHSEWIVWFDDDSFPFRADWESSLRVAIAAQPEAAMLGVPAEVTMDVRMARWVESAPWYRGVPWLGEVGGEGLRRIEFILGGFWVLRTEWIWRLDWPDARLGHFGDDVALGEAIRQQGGKLGFFRSGVRIDTAPRRAPSDWREGVF